MTRFARAKGSKASNERAPEDATPWAVMKEQLQRAKEDADQAKLREQNTAEKQRLENYENFLQERKTAKRKSTWCDFPNPKSSFQESPAKQSKSETQSYGTHEEGEAENNRGTDSVGKNKKKKNKDTNNQNEAFTSPEKISKKKTKSKLRNENEASEESFSQQSVVNGHDDIKSKKNKEKKHKDLNSQNEALAIASLEKISKKKKSKIKNANEASEESLPQQSVANGHDDVKLKKKKKKKQICDNPEKSGILNKIQKRKFTSSDCLTDTSNSNGNQKSDSILETADSSPSKETNNKAAGPSKKQKKDRNKQRRKPETDRSFQVIINGRSVDLVRFDGFPVMKKDAERLQQLKVDMMKKGIPRREVDRTMKLERRRAEKALARIKRDVCYNCRKGGHNLSDCPDLRARLPPAGEEADGAAEGVDTADGVCFKCGSTEHRQNECRVQKGQQFRFASCFICKEQGHIARQCPDNPKGLYPNGGSCKLCGDVTHLRKDCPTTKSEKEEVSVRLETLVTVDGVEDLPAPTTAVQLSHTTKKPKKITF